jgi:hypothetical protein
MLIDGMHRERLAWRLPQGPRPAIFSRLFGVLLSGRLAARGTHAASSELARAGAACPGPLAIAWWGRHVVGSHCLLPGEDLRREPVGSQ